MFKSLVFHFCASRLQLYLNLRGGRVIVPDLFTEDRPAKSGASKVWKIGSPESKTGSCLSNSDGYVYVTMEMQRSGIVRALYELGEPTTSSSINYHKK